MLDYIVYHFPSIAIIIISLFAVVKVVLFIGFKTKNWRAVNLLYFPFQNIKLTSDPKRQAVKKLQNNFSVTILVLAILYLLYKLCFSPS